MAFEYEGEFSYGGDSYYEPNIKGYSQYDIDQQNKRNEELNKKYAKIVAFVMGTCILIAFSLEIYDNYKKKHQEKQKTEFAQPKSNKVVNMQNTLKMMNFIRQR